MTKKIGLALGGGGAKGWAHVGVLRALEEHKIPIHCIAGTSIGALVGAIYVRGELAKLEQFAEEVSIDNLVALMDITFPGLGLVDGQRVREFLKEYLVDAQVEECKIPFRCVATNFLDKEEVVFESGSMVDAVRASISLPGIFAPCKHNGAYLVDGGVLNPLPVNVVRAMGADVVIAVNLNHDPDSAHPQVRTEKAERSPEADCVKPAENEASGAENSQQNSNDLAQRIEHRYQNLKGVLQDQIDDWVPDPSTGLNIFDVIGNSIQLMEQQVTRVRLQVDVPDVLIQPALTDINIFDFQEAKSSIQRGYDAAIETISEIKTCLEKATSQPSSEG